MNYKTLIIMIAIIYSVYAALAMYALDLSVKKKRPTFIHLVPAITNSLHILAIALSPLFLKDWDSYPVEPKHLYLTIDFIMSASAGVSMYALTLGKECRDDNYFKLAAFNNLIVILGTAMCLRKTMLLSNAL